jgi:hypothetical protein
VISEKPPVDAVGPLPLWPTVVETWRLLAGNFALLAKLTALPFFLLLVITTLTAQLDRLAIDLIWEFGIEVPWTFMAVAWLRLLLLPEQAGKPPFFPAPERRHLRFLFYALLLSFVTLPMTLFAYIAEALALEGTTREIAYWSLDAVTLYLGLRLSFIYTAVAVDEPYSLALSWRHTRGCSVKLFVVVGLVTTAPWQAFSALMGLIDMSDTATAIGFELLWNVMLWLVEATYLAFIVVAFRRVTGWVPKADKRIVERFD